MKKSQRMQPLLNLATGREQQAAQDLGECQQNLHAKQARLTELSDYRTEYAQRFHAQGAEGLDGTQLRTYQAFMVQLDNAIHQQREAVTNATLECENKKEHWYAQHTHTEILGKAVSRYQTHERYELGRREQIEADDHVSSRPKIKGQGSF